MFPSLLLDIKNLDFGNVTDVAGYGLLLISCADKLGLTTSNEPTIGSRSQITKLAERWSRGVERSIDRLSPADALEILETYDLVKRIILSREPDADFMFRNVDRALDPRIHGDESINRYKLYDRISAGLRCKEKAYYGRPLDWTMGMLDSWHNEFLSGQYTGFTPATDYDIISRVAILLTADLSAFEFDPEAYKRQLFDNHRHHLEEVTEAYETWSAETTTDYDFKTVEALSRFLQASCPYLDSDEYERYHAAILTALFDKTTSPYHRAALTTALSASHSPIPAA